MEGLSMQAILVRQRMCTADMRLTCAVVGVWRCQIQIASGCTLVSVLLHGPTSYDCPRTDSSPRPATFQLRYNDVHVRVVVRDTSQGGIAF